MLSGHLQREQGNRGAGGRNIERDIDGERRLAHSGTRRQNYELASSQSTGCHIESRESGEHVVFQRHA